MKVVVVGGAGYVGSHLAAGRRTHVSVYGSDYDTPDATCMPIEATRIVRSLALCMTQGLE